MMRPDQTGLADKDVKGKIHQIVLRVSTDKEWNPSVESHGRLKEVFETDSNTARSIYDLGVHRRQESPGPQGLQRLRREHSLRKDHHLFETEPCNVLMGLHPPPSEE